VHLLSGLPVPSLKIGQFLEDFLVLVLVLEALDWTQPIVDHTRLVADHHESLDPATVHLWWLDQLPPGPAAILDIGAGSGRDAAWLAAKGEGLELQRIRFHHDQQVPES
jgi:hypothetical protein